MRSNGMPSVSKGSIKLGPAKANVSPGQDNKGNGKINLDLPTPTNDDRFKISPNYVDITRLRDDKGNYIVPIEIQNKSSKGTFEIKNIKLKGYKIYLEKETSDDKGISKKDAIQVMDNAYQYIDGDGVHVGEKYTRSIIKEPVDTKAKPSDKTIKLNKDDIKFNVIFQDIEDAGKDLSNILFLIKHMDIDYKFTPTGGAPVTNTYKVDFERPMTYFIMKDNLTLPFSASYHTDYATAFHVTRKDFKLHTFKCINELISPYFVLAYLTLLSNYGIENFYYNPMQLLTTSRVKSDLSTTCMLINFYNIFDENISTLTSLDFEIKHKDKDKVVILKKTIKVENQVFSVMSSDLPKSYSAVTIFKDNPAAYQKFYFMVDNSSLNINVLSSTAGGYCDLTTSFDMSGDTNSGYYACSYVQQFTMDLAKRANSSSIQAAIIYAPFAAYTSIDKDLSSMYILYCLYYLNCNFITTQGVDNANRSNFDMGTESARISKSIAYKNTSVKNAINTLSSSYGLMTKNYIMTLSNSKDNIYTLYCKLAGWKTEVSIPKQPFSVTLEIEKASDLFNPDKNLFLSEEVRAWVIFSLSDLFSYNKTLPSFSTTEYFNLLLDNKKPMNKKLYIAKTIDGHLINPFYDFENKKIVGDLTFKLINKADYTEINNQLESYLVKIKDSKNEILKYIVKHLMRFFSDASRTRIMDLTTSKGLVPNDEFKQVVETYSTDLYTEPLLIDDKNTLAKRRQIDYSLPTRSGKQNTQERRIVDGDVYTYLDDHLEYSPNHYKYIKNTNNIIGLEVISLYV